MGPAEEDHGKGPDDRDARSGYDEANPFYTSHEIDLEEEIEIAKEQLISLNYALRFQFFRFGTLLLLEVIVASAVAAATIGRFMKPLDIYQGLEGEAMAALSIFGIFILFELSSACVSAAAFYYRGRRTRAVHVAALKNAEFILFGPMQSGMQHGPG